MDTRHLSCLIVAHGTAMRTEIHSPTARVAALQTQLCARIASDATVCGDRTATAPCDLTLFHARRNDSSGDNAWLRSADEDVYALALGEDLEKGNAAAARYLAPHSWMDPDEWLRAYFPEQPPLHDRTGTPTIHVLVRVTRPPLPTTPLVPHGGWTAKLVSSFLCARFVVPHSGASNSRMRPMAAAATVVRCTDSQGMLWLPDDDGDATDWSKTRYYIPQTWRELSAAICEWVMAESNVTPRKSLYFAGELRGHRAVVTGASRVGKSVFVAFLLLQLLRTQTRPPPVCIVDVPGVTFARIDVERGTVDEGDRHVNFQDELSDVHTVYLYDVSSTTSASVNPLCASTVYARSIIVRPHQFVARRTTRTQSFVLPLWSLDDVQQCAQQCFPLLALPPIIALFHHWGGVPGRLFVRDAARSKQALELALARITARKLKTVLTSVQRTGTWAATAKSNDGAMWRPLVVAVAATHARAVHRFAGDVRFTSQYVCDRVLALSPLRTCVLRGLAAPQQPMLWASVHKSLAFLAQEEEEKHDGAIVV